MDAPVSSTCELSILGLRATVAGPRCLVREAARLFPGRGARATVATAIEILREDDGCYTLTRDGRRLATTSRRGGVLPLVEWAVNAVAVRANSERYLLFHAGSASLHGQGVLLPAASGSGKTTLVAALVAGGFGCLGEDVAALHAETLLLHPVQKNLCLKGGTRDQLKPLYPQLGEVSPRWRADGEPVWYLNLAPGAWEQQPPPIRHIVLPRFSEGEGATMVEVPRSRGLLCLMEQSFTMAAREPPGIGCVTRALQDARCYELTYGNAVEAAELLHRCVLG